MGIYSSFWKNNPEGKKHISKLPDYWGGPVTTFSYEKDSFCFSATESYALLYKNICKART